MNITDIAKVLRENEQVSSIDEGKEVVEAVLHLIREATYNDEEVHLKGFGVFSAKLRAARMGRNPHTSESVPIPEQYGVKFKASKQWREMLNGK